MEIIGIILGLAGTIIWGFGTVGLSGRTAAILSVQRHGYNLNMAAEIGKQRMATVIGVSVNALGVLASIVALFVSIPRTAMLVVLSFSVGMLIIVIYFIVVPRLVARSTMLKTLKYFYFDMDNRASSWDTDNNVGGWRERTAKMVGVDPSITKESFEQLIKSR